MDDFYTRWVLPTWIKDPVHQADGNSLRNPEPDPHPDRQTIYPNRRPTPSPSHVVKRGEAKPKPNGSGNRDKPA